MRIYPSQSQSKPLVTPKFGKSPEKDFETFISFCKNLSNTVDEELIRKSFKLTYKVHRNSFRKSGDPFYTHPLEVATITVQYISYDDTLVASALLHDVLSADKNLKEADIQSEFGETIAKIVESVHKITFLERQSIFKDEYYRLLLLSLLTDVRIILVKMADRLHDMKTAEYLPIDVQKKLAEDTLQIYSPFAHRFGLWNIKAELEDYAFRILDRENYNYVAKKVKISKSQLEEALIDFAKPIIRRLREAVFLKSQNINFEIWGRVKHFYSIYTKTLIRNRSIDELYDIIALRIILHTEDPSVCYMVYNEICELYQPVDGTYKDYIKNPKPNGYQSIHCAFYDMSGQKIEIQIRTIKMHEIAERGIAAHYNYKRGLVPANSVLEDPKIAKWIEEVRSIIDSAQEVPLMKLLEGFAYTLTINQIFVLTPTNEIKVLPKGATVLDFAYYVHSDVGNYCVGAKVNGRVVPLNYVLSNGEQCEIITVSKPQVNIDWLNIVKTKRAINSIQNYFKTQRKTLTRFGKEKFEEKLKNKTLPIPKQKLFAFLDNLFKFRTQNNFYFKYQNNPLFENTVGELIDVVIENQELLNSSAEELEKVVTSLEKYNRWQITSIINNPEIKITFEECCYPVPDEEAYGVYFEEEMKFQIHRVCCPTFQTFRVENKEKIYKINWELFPKKDFKLVAEFKTRVRRNYFFEILFSALKEFETNQISAQSFQVTQTDNWLVAVIKFNLQNLRYFDYLTEKIQQAEEEIIIHRIGC